MRTICDACFRGEHGHCSEIVARAVDDVGRPIPRAGYIDCRCLCDVRERVVDHLKLASLAAESGRLAEAQKHTDAARELLGPEVTPPAKAPRRRFVLVDPGRFYEGASARRGGGRS